MLMSRRHRVGTCCTLVVYTTSKNDQTDDHKTNLYIVDIRYESDHMWLTTHDKRGRGSSVTLYRTEVGYKTWNFTTQHLEVMAARILLLC